MTPFNKLSGLVPRWVALVSTLIMNELLLMNFTAAQPLKYCEKIMLYDPHSRSGTLQDSVKKKIRNYNNELFTTSFIAIVYGGTNPDPERFRRSVEFLQEEGILNTTIQNIEISKPSKMAELKVSGGGTYLFFLKPEPESMASNYTDGMHPISLCPKDTILRYEEGFGLYYNECDLEDKKTLPKIKLWGKSTFNGSYEEAPSLPQKYNMNQVLEIFTVIRNDSDEIYDNILIPAEKSIRSKSIQLEKYLPRAKVWTKVSNESVSIFERNQRKYFNARIRSSGHFRIIREPDFTTPATYIRAPDKTCFKSITIKDSASQRWLGILTNGKTGATFLIPRESSALICTATLEDEYGNLIEIKETPLSSISACLKIEPHYRESTRVIISQKRTPAANCIIQLKIKNDLAVNNLSSN